MQQIDINKAKGQLDRLFQSALSGEEILITQNDRPVLKLIRIYQSQKRRRSGSGKGLFSISEDFEQPLEDFREYMR